MSLLVFFAIRDSRLNLMNTRAIIDKKIYFYCIAKILSISLMRNYRNKFGIYNIKNPWHDQRVSLFPTLNSTKLSLRNFRVLLRKPAFPLLSIAVMFKLIFVSLMWVRSYLEGCHWHDRIRIQITHKVK